MSRKSGVPHTDEREFLTIEIPASLRVLCARNGIDPGEVIAAFVKDLCQMRGGAKHERDAALAYFQARNFGGAIH